MNRFIQQIETLTFAAADTVKTTSIALRDLGFPFSNIVFTKSGGATAMTVNVGAGSMRGDILFTVVEAGAETVALTLLLDGIITVPAPRVRVLASGLIVAATGLAGAASPGLAYVLNLELGVQA